MRMYLLGEHLRVAAECLKTLNHHIYERRKLAGECTNDGFLGGDRRKKKKKNTVFYSDHALSRQGSNCSDVRFSAFGDSQ